MSSESEKTELEKRWEAELAAEETAVEEAEEAPTEGEEEACATAPVSAEEAEAIAAERDELKDQLLRARAEFDNFRKRTARETARVRTMAAESLIRDLLPVVDHLELALQHKDDDSGGFSDGVAMVLKQCHDLLVRHGVESIAAVGATFNPNMHEAMMQQPSDDVPAATVIEEFQKGYRLGDTVLRHSRVIVSTGPESSSDTETSERMETDENTSAEEDPTLVDS